MPRDEATDGADNRSGEPESTQPTAPGQTAGDSEQTSPPGSAAPTSRTHEGDPGATEEDRANAESEAGEKEAATDQAESKPLNFGARMLALERRGDAQANADTSLPDSEAVTLRSVTVSEIYAGQAVRTLTTALAAIDWVNFDEPILDLIAEARRGYQYSRGVFWLVDDPAHIAPLIGYGRMTLPDGIDRIYGEYDVLGPSIVAVVLTFVLAEDEAKRIEGALREDAQSKLDRFGSAKFSVKTVRDVKRERIRGIHAQVAGRCQAWLKNSMPGTLSTAREGFSPPICALVSLAAGKPFETSAGYMELLDLTRPYLAEKFVSHEFLFLIHSSDIAADSEILAAFNETAAAGAGWLHDTGAAPEVFHEEISSLMIAAGLSATLLSFSPRLRDIRADLDQLDFDKQTGSQVVALRDRLLELSRDLSIVSSDVTVLVDDPFVIWRDYSPLVQVRQTGSTTETTGDTKRQQLRALLVSLQAQEAGLRDLILVTSQSIGETRNLKLTNRLYWLTWVLALLRAALVFLAIEQAVHPVTVNVKETPSPAKETSSPQPGSPRISHTASPSGKTR